MGWNAIKLPRLYTEFTLETRALPVDEVSDNARIIGEANGTGEEDIALAIIPAHAPKRASPKSDGIGKGIFMSAWGKTFMTKLLTTQ